MRFMKPFEQAWTLLKANEGDRMRMPGSETRRQTVHPAIAGMSERYFAMPAGMASALGEIEMQGMHDTVHTPNFSFESPPTFENNARRISERGTPHDALEDAMSYLAVSQDTGDLPEEYFSDRVKLPEEVADPDFIAQDRQPWVRENPRLHAANIDDELAQEFRERLEDHRSSPGYRGDIPEGI